MGLTIHYELRTSLAQSDDIRTLVDSLRQVAGELPFKEVGDLVELAGADCDFEHGGQDDELRWLKIQSEGHVERGESYFRVKPSRVIAFTTWPGEGCEAANFGLCKYPGFVDISGGGGGPKKRLATHLDGWRWGSCCKTQYASDPECGGVENFVRCHLAIVKLLDFAKDTGLMTVTVRDEAGYWEQRSVDDLAREVGQWNELVAAVAGEIKDVATSQGIIVESAIAGFANFEHLEAKGLERLKGLRSRQDRRGE